jgi:atlastin
MRNIKYYFTVNSASISNEQDSEENEVTSHEHPYGRSINIFKFDENEVITIDDDALEKIFLHPEVRNRKIAAVSIIGAFRKGKSFLMDYALRYMYGNVSDLFFLMKIKHKFKTISLKYKSVSFMNNTLDKKNNWIGSPDKPLKGFSWRGGTGRDTTGVTIWSDVFLHEDKNQKYAIVLMDTQGLFDTKTSPAENSRIFALGTLLSSIQIFNLNDVIQENQLEYLQVGRSS